MDGFLYSASAVSLGVITVIGKIKPDIFFRVYLCAFALFSLHLAAPCFLFLGHAVAFFQHGPCAGLVLWRSAWSRGALSGIAALCVACVSVVVSVNSYVLVRV